MILKQLKCSRLQKSKKQVNSKGTVSEQTNTENVIPLIPQVHHVIESYKSN